jgi:hypothetical protein
MISFNNNDDDWSIADDEIEIMVVTTIKKSGGSGVI